MTNKRDTGPVYSQLRVVQQYGAPLCALNLVILKVMCRVHGVGSALILSAQPALTMENSKCTPVLSHLRPRCAYILDHYGHA